MPRTYRAVEIAFELAATTANLNNLPIDAETLHSRAYNWYCNSDVVDPEILAGCALSADYKFGYTYDDMLAFAEVWFPLDPEAGAPIWRIENALKDTFWHCGEQSV